MSAASNYTETNVIEVDSVQVANPEVKVCVSGGVNGSTYDIEVTAATTGGRIKVECFKIRLKDC